MNHLLATAFITLLALGTGCAWISPSSQTTSDGIQVHGHWSMTITNPDGTVDAVHEFENAFTPTGSGVVTGLLSGDTSLEAWQIDFQTVEDWDCLEGIGQGLSSKSPIVTARVTRDESIDAPLRLSATCTMIKGQSDFTTLSAVKTLAVGTMSLWSDHTQSWMNSRRRAVFSEHNMNGPTLEGNQRVVANVRFTFVSGHQE